LASVAALLTRKHRGEGFVLALGVRTLTS